MSDFPIKLDDDATLPPVNDNIQDIGAEAINALRDAVFNIEQYLGLDGPGTTDSLAARIGVSLDLSGSIKPSAITSLGLVTLPITNDQIADSAEIPEYKLKLDHRTQDLFNYILDLSKNVNTALGWISLTGVKLEPHLNGFIYRHTLNQIDVSISSTDFLKNRFNNLRNNHDSYTVIDDLNDEVLNHQFADGTGNSTQLISTIGGSNYPSNYAHTSSGIWLNTSRFSVIPQTATDLQQFADFIDSSSIFLYGTRIQNLYTNGISRSSRSSSLTADGYGIAVIPSTIAIAYLLNTGSSSFPIDDIDIGDDIIELKPTASEMSSNSFDEKFSLVKIGDVIKINYGTVEVSFIIKEKKYIQNGGNKKYVVRINGKNLFYTTNALIRIDRPLFNNNKHGVLAISPVNNVFSEIPSLIIGSPYGAQVLGIGFNPDQLNTTHYLMYLALYTTGNPQDGFTILPAIDVTGNRGVTPGSYTLDSVVEATNNAFRQAGFNYRFIAFSHQGEFGIMLADSYGNAGFSILSAVVADDGTYDSSATGVSFPNNVIDVFPTAGMGTIDPLGFGINGANFASPEYKTSYGSAEAALIPTKIFLPLKRNNFYVNGIEKDKLALDIDQLIDGYGDGYWNAAVQAINIFPGPNGRVQVTYRIHLDLSTSGLKVGKTLVVQPTNQTGLVDFGRYIIQDITFNIPDCADCSPVIPNNIYTDITVYDAVHATGVSPTATLAIDSLVRIYFNAGSVSFNRESATDFNSVQPFKRHFEVYVDQNGNTFTHERARINAGGSTFNVNGIPLRTFSELSKLNIIKVSSKLRGYQFGSVNKITLHVTDFNDITGTFIANLVSYDGSTSTHNGPTTLGKVGQTTRFYDETNIDYIDIIFDNNVAIAGFSDQYIDFQLFPTLSLDEEIMLLGTCQVNDVTNVVNLIKDERQFGNTSEKDFSTSALGFISLPEKLLHSNGVIRGFDLQDPDILTNPNSNQIYLNGGLVLVNGKFISVNSETVIIPIVKENFGTLNDINWLVCINDKGEYQPIPLLDFDQWLSTPTDSNRRFQAINVVNGLNYYIDASTFSDVVNKRKDLTPLYIVASTVTVSVTPVVSMTITDARKYVNDADSSLPLTLTSAEAQGNFKKPESILNWIKYNNQFNGTAFIKGANAGNATIDATMYLDFANSVVIDGKNDALLTMNGTVILGSNLTFKNLDIVFNGSTVILDGVKNLIFDNCNITVNVPSTSPPNNIIFSIINGDNVVIKDSSLIVQYASLYDSSQTFRGSVFYLNNTINFKLTNTIVTANYVISAGVVTPGDVFTLVNSPICYITDSIISGNFNKLVDITNSNFFKLTNAIVTSIYNPNAGGTADSYNGVSYDPLDLVNSGQGYIHGNVTTVLDSIIIDNVVFNYTPSINSNDRYSFINFELSTIFSVLSELQVTNCKFNNLNVSGVKDDTRAAISIINNASPVAAPAIQPTLLNAVISGNYCNKNQAIVVTSVSRFGVMLFPGITTQNCLISNNVCGTIGYLVGSETKIISLSPVVNAFNDKITGLTISNNSCHYIANLDSTGKYFLMSKVSTTSPFTGTTVNQVNYSTGNVDIVNNKCSWIHTGLAYEENSTLRILNNTLSAYDGVYLVNYNDALPNAIYNPSASGVNVSSNYAIFVSTNKHVLTNSQAPGEGLDSCCIISGNITNTGYWNAINFAPVPIKYGLGYIYCQSSCTVTNNTLKGVGETFGFGSLILVGGKNSIIENNKIYRSSHSIFAYVAFVNFETPTAWNGAESTGIVVNNFFDSPYINDVIPQTVDTIKTIRLDATSANATNWILERNINQTVTMAFNSSSGQHTGGSVHRIFPGTLPSGIDAWSQDDPASTVKIIYISGSGLLDNYQWTIPAYALIPKRTKIVRAYVTVTNTSLTTISSPYSLTIIDPIAATSDSDSGNLQFSLSDSAIVTPTSVYQNTEDGVVMVRFNLSMQSGNSLTVNISNIHIQYRW
jgi:hypothetical protein